MVTNSVTRHFDEVATWTRGQVVKHLEDDHGAVADEDAPWQHHRRVHWRDDQPVKQEGAPK